MQPGDRSSHERVLRDAAIAGNADAWQAWYDESFDRLYAYNSWRSAGLSDLIDDVVQETWLIAVRSLRRFEPERGCFVDWLRGIAANVLRNQRRRLRRPQPVRHASSAPPEDSDETRERAE